MALDTLRAAVWPPSDVPLDRAGRRLLGWRDRPVCIELYYRRRDRRFRSGTAVDCGGMVCAADGVPADRWMIFCVMEIWKTAARADGKAIHNLMEKGKPFPQVCKQLSHSLAILAVYAHSHNAYYGEICFSYRNRNPFMLKLKYIL